ncbi:hypothetical protein C3747_128g7 [Trypanosoma cruzi]|uniref:Protein dpy-30 homolog n=1 Tax=Trypanosoma cruzi TaxID=5693 RepID=A0A2V2WAD0_TRYCR|nr:hypothetical protein C3747_128g7 [Trypanosoma cruzi]
MRRDIPSVSTSRAEPQKQQGGHAAMTLESTRAYLDHTCVPLLMEAMAAVSRVRPDDPIDFIAHYLLKHNPNRRGTNTQHLDNDPRGSGVTDNPLLVLLLIFPFCVCSISLWLFCFCFCFFFSCAGNVC